MTIVNILGDNGVDACINVRLVMRMFMPTTVNAIVATISRYYCQRHSGSKQFVSRSPIAILRSLCRQNSHR